MTRFETIAIVALVGAVGYLLGRAPLDRPLLADTSANGDRHVVAVAGPYQNGVSLLYVIDTETKQLAVYEARGGSKSMARINLVAARRIDLDLRLEGYRDESEYSFADLAAHFRKNGWTDVRTVPPGEAADSRMPATSPAKDR